MKKRKTLQELTITDGFMFGAVMEDPENCRLLLERVLERPISKVEVITEKSLTYSPEYRGVRLDVYASDESGSHFEVEMQVRLTPVEKRSRYYHSQMDMELLLSGVDYEDLTDSYVIFICCYDHFNQGKYRYTIHSHCLECPDIDVNDGVHTIVLNNGGTNPDEVPKELVSFLQYTRRSLAELEDESDDPYIKRLQNSIQRIKHSRKMEEKYMQFQEMLKEEHKEGFEEGRNHFAFDMISDGILSLEKGAEKLNMKPEELEQKLGKYKAFREADD